MLRDTCAYRENRETRNNVYGRKGKNCEKCGQTRRALRLVSEMKTGRVGFAFGQPDDGKKSALAGYRNREPRPGRRSGTRQIDVTNVRLTGKWPMSRGGHLWKAAAGSLNGWPSCWTRRRWENVFRGRRTDFVCADNDVPGTHGGVAPIGRHTQRDACVKHARFVRLWDSGFPNTNVVCYSAAVLHASPIAIIRCKINV